MRLEPLGDQAVVAYFDRETDGAVLADHVRRLAPGWLVDVVHAYFSVAVYYEIEQIDCFQVSDWLRQVADEDGAKIPPSAVPLHVIPCCYEFGLDFERIEKHAGLDREAVMNLHASTTYTVYAIGFCPGFPYLGYLPTELAGVPRLESPRLRVEEGSVGLTGRQTGIYTESRPGGWNIIGRTPMRLVDVAAGYFPLRTGDQVRFRAIDTAEYRELERRG